MPWVLEEWRRLVDGTSEGVPREIDRSSLTGARFDFSSDTIWTVEGDLHVSEDIYIEQNHLKAWLEKRKRPAEANQLVQSAPAKEDRVPKNMGKGGRPASSLRADVRIQLTAFAEKRGKAWVKDQTTSQLAKEVRSMFQKKKPPVHLGPRQTLEDWIGQWRSERDL